MTGVRYVPKEMTYGMLYNIMASKEFKTLWIDAGIEAATVTLWEDILTIIIPTAEKGTSFRYVEFSYDEVESSIFVYDCSDIDSDFSSADDEDIDEEQLAIFLAKEESNKRSRAIVPIKELLEDDKKVPVTKVKKQSVDFKYMLQYLKEKAK